MYERTHGEKYDASLDTAQIARRIRADIKTAVGEGLLPERWTYSVVIGRGSMTSSIDVRVKDCLDAWTPCPGYKLGTRHELDNGGYVATACGDVWCKAAHPDKPGAEFHDVLSEEAQAAKVTLKRIHDAYNYDGSESQSDYFDVNYYGGVTFQDARSARFDTEEKARLAARRAELDAATETFRVKVYGRRGTTVHVAAQLDGSRARLMCGAQLRRSSLWSKTDDTVTCSRCAKREDSCS